MASIFFDTSGPRPVNQWRCKYRSLEAGRIVWRTKLLGEHPRWRPGHAKPTRPPHEVLIAYRQYEDEDAAAKKQSKTRLADHAGRAIVLQFVQWCQQNPSANLKDSAHRFLDEREGGKPRVTIQDFLAAHRAHYNQGFAENTVIGAERAIEKFQTWSNENDVQFVTDVDVEACKKFIKDRMGQASRGTVKLDRAGMAAAWARAVEDGELQENPWTKARLPGKDRTENPPWWTPDEIDAILEHAKPWVRPIVIVGVHSGLRVSSLSGLLASDVDFKREVIHVRAANSKNGRPYDAPLLKPARDILEPLLVGRRPESKVFPFAERGGELTANASYYAIRTAARKARVRDLGHYNHILRHTFATCPS